MNNTLGFDSGFLDQAFWLTGNIGYFLLAQNIADLDGYEHSLDEEDPRFR